MGDPKRMGARSLAPTMMTIIDSNQLTATGGCAAVCLTPRVFHLARCRSPFSGLPRCRFASYLFLAVVLFGRRTARSFPSDILSRIGLPHSRLAVGRFASGWLSRVAALGVSLLGRHFAH